MPPIATASIWLETPLDLAVRWHRAQPPAVREDAGRPADALARAEERAAKLLNYAGLKPLRRIKTLREWETRWDAGQAWRMLEKSAASQKLRIVVHRGHGQDFDLASDVLKSSESDTIVLDQPALEDQARSAREHGLSVPLTKDDMLVIGLAHEMYERLTDRAGKPPLPWIRDLAEPLFVQQLLGLPFSPLVWRFLPRAEV